MNKTRISPQTFFNAFSSEYEEAAAQDSWHAPRHVFETIEKHRMSAINNPGKKIYLLDIGIGTGLASQFFRKAVSDIHITGIDSSEKMLKICEQKKIANSLMPRNLDHGICYAPDTFDIVISSGVFEYLDAPRKLIQEMAHVTKPGGLVCFTTELTPPPSSARITGEDGNVCTPIGGNACLYTRVLDKNEMLEALDKAGFVLLEEPEEFVAYRSAVGDTLCRSFIAQKPKACAGNEINI